MKKILFVALTLLLIVVSGCTKRKEQPGIKEATIEVSDFKSVSVVEGQNDVYIDTMTLTILNSTEIYDRIIPQFTRKIQNDGTILQQLSSVMIEKRGAKVSNNDVTMDVGHYSTLSSGSPNYNFRIGKYRFIASIGESGIYTISFAPLS